jgi:hypothetical protein
MTPTEHAEMAYNIYCKAVGGRAFNGDPLPTWKEFSEDETKKKQSNAWIRVGAYITECEVELVK